MDKTTLKLANYVAALSFDRLSAVAVHETKRRLIDSIGCAIGGYSSEPASIAREIAAEHSGHPSARVLGSGAATSMEMANFANAVMGRYFDCNDTYLYKGSGQLSDIMN